MANGILKDTHSVDVGVWVLRLAVFRQHPWSNVVDLADEFEHRVVREMLLCEFSLRHVPWIRLAEDCMPVPRHDLPAL